MASKKQSLSNALPEVFIASSASKRSLEIAYSVQRSIEKSADVNVWDQGVFKPSNFTLEQLLITLDQSDFGVFIFSPDDVVRIKGKQYQSVRDNVVFELGMFIGKLGRQRCFIIMPDNCPDLRILSDLAGLTILSFKAGQKNLKGALGPSCFDITQVIDELGFFRSPQHSDPSDRNRLKDIGAKVSRPAPLASKKFVIDELPERVLDDSSALPSPKRKGRKSTLVS